LKLKLICVAGVMLRSSGGYILILLNEPARPHQRPQSRDCTNANCTPESRLNRAAEIALLDWNV